MGTFGTFNIVKVTKQEEYLRVDHRHGSIEAQIRIIIFKDKDTKQYVVLAPSLDVTGYGSTKKKAMEMLKFSLDDFNMSLIGMPIGNISAFLKKLGWKRGQLKNKNFSKSYIDINGELKGFNIEDNKVESEILTLS